MQLGDLTSGINMLPDDSLNQGIQDYFKQDASIAAQKGQLAQNKINEINNLLNVNLKGLQARDMDEAVAARDKLIEDATEAARKSSIYSGEIPWPDMKNLIAQKATLEQLVQQSQQNQQLYNTRYQQILNLRDPVQQKKALANLNAVHNLKSVAERNAFLNNPQLIPNVDITYSDYGKSLNLNSRSYSKQNVQQIGNIVKGDFENKNPLLMALYEKYKADNPKALDDDFLKYATANTINHTLSGLSFKDKQDIITANKEAAKNYVAPVTVQEGKKGVVSFMGAASNNKKRFYLPSFSGLVLDKKTGKTTEGSYKGGQLSRIYKHNGKYVADIVVPATKSQATATDNGTEGSLLKHVGTALDTLTNVLRGSNKGTKVVTVPVSELRNMFKNRNIRIEGTHAAEIMNAIFQKGDNNGGVTVSSGVTSTTPPQGNNGGGAVDPFMKASSFRK